MTEQLRIITDLFANNVEIMMQNFKWDNGLTHRMAAFQYSVENKEVDIKAIKEAKILIKDNTGMFSIFKDAIFLITATMVSLQETPASYFKHSFDIYNRMKKFGFNSSNYLAISALTIAKKTAEEEFDSVIKTTKNYYDRMKKEHRFLTSSNDYCFATMLGMSGLSIDSSIREIEECYNQLKGHFLSNNSIQSLSHVLAFGEESASVKCHRVMKLYDTLKAKKCKIGGDGELTSLGILALITEDVEMITENIVELSTYLQTKKGFGSFSSSKAERIRYATALVASTYVENMKNDMLNITLANSFTNILIAQETAMIAAITASTVAASSASSN